ncbi:hypothetical protein GWK47_037112 [Chionoecetes opilio]|uniref:Uncharacterized protein n=1 Tax=Chionoecetes opilio TaxID=41210 RepID=A0A8J5D1K1_CHIOP|nr:hypothetical protein GWK47_037112 [Chionoecetes opilio]
MWGLASAGVFSGPGGPMGLGGRPFNQHTPFGHCGGMSGPSGSAPPRPGPPTHTPPRGGGHRGFTARGSSAQIPSSHTPLHKALTTPLEAVREAGGELRGSTSSSPGNVVGEGKKGGTSCRTDGVTPTHARSSGPAGGAPCSPRSTRLGWQALPPGGRGRFQPLPKPQGAHQVRPISLSLRLNTGKRCSCAAVARGSLHPTCLGSPAVGTADSLPTLRLRPTTAPKGTVSSTLRKRSSWPVLPILAPSRGRGPWEDCRLVEDTPTVGPESVPGGPKNPLMGNGERDPQGSSARSCSTSDGGGWPPALPAGTLLSVRRRPGPRCHRAGGRLCKTQRSRPLTAVRGLGPKIRAAEVPGA